MRIKHSVHTRTVAPASSDKPSEEAGGVYGAIPIDDEGGQTSSVEKLVGYRISTDLDEIVNVPDRIMGVDLDDLKIEVKRRHAHASGYAMIAEYTHRFKYNAPLRHYLLITDKPVIDDTDLTVEQLKDISQQHGVLWLTQEAFETLNAKLARNGGNYRPVASSRSSELVDEDFTVTAAYPKAEFTGDGECKLFAVNWNPRHACLRPYYQAKKQYKSRTATDFSKQIKHSLFHALNPRYWSNCKWDKIVTGPDPYERYGWGHRRMCDVSTSDILLMLQLNKKIGPSYGWWRNERHYRGTYSFEGAVKQALEVIHSVEKHCNDKLLRLSESFVQVYAEYNSQHNRPASMAEYRKHIWSDKSGVEFYRQQLQLCRWIRREARALKLEIPLPPVAPMTPSQIERNKRRAAKLRRQAARARRKEKLKHTRKTNEIASGRSHRPDDAVCAAVGG